MLRRLVSKLSNKLAARRELEARVELLERNLAVLLGRVLELDGVKLGTKNRDRFNTTVLSTNEEQPNPRKPTTTVH